MGKMKLKLAQIRPNPFRDFDLYPYDEEQIQRLTQSMDSLGFFSGVTARLKNGTANVYELAAGHHRLKAAERAGLKEVEAVVEDYDDDQMVEIMTVENLTQRGHNAASVLDSVAARCKLIAKDVLLGEGPCSKILEHAGPEYLSRAQAHIAKEGPGMPLVYRAINRFSKEDRKVNKEAENIKSTEIDHALSMLKNSGKMGELISAVYADVEAIRAERAEAARVKREKEEQTVRDAEAKRREEEKRQEAELKKKQEAEKQAEWDRQQAEERDAKTKAAAAVEAEKAKQEREAAEAALKAQREADKEAREAEKKAEAERKAEAKAEADRLDKERKAVAAQKKLEAVYDIACVNVFRLTSHEATFREAVLSDNGKRFIPKDQQHALAKQIRAEIDTAEKRSGRDLGSVTIVSMIEAHLARLIGIQRDIDKKEKEELLRASAQKRVEELWKILRRGLVQSEGALEKLVNEQTGWAYDKALFPIHFDDIDRIITIGRRMQGMKKALGF